MSFTYSGDPRDSDLDATRFLLGDTDSSSPRLQNEEILYLLAEHTTPRKAAQAGANNLTAKYATLADKSVGDLSINYGNLRDSFKSIADNLSAASDSSVYLNIAPYAGGTTRAPWWWDGQFDNPPTSAPYGSTGTALDYT